MVNLPTNCPVCGAKLEWKGVDLVCNNPECDNRKQADLELWTEILGEYEGLAWTTKKKYLDDIGIKSIEDLDKYLKEDFDTDTRYNSITDNKVKDMMSKIKNEEFTLAQGLQALNIERLGKESSLKISEDKSAYNFIMTVVNNDLPTDYSFEDIEKVVGQATAKTVADNQSKLKRLKFIKIKPFEEKVQVELKGTFCITGKLNRGSRDEIIKLAESKGWKSLKGVTKDCNYLVTNDTTSGSSKNKKAQQLGTKIISEDEFFTLIGE